MAWHVAVVGTGGWSRVHLAALAASPHVERVTLVGRNEQSLAERAAEFPIVAATANDVRPVLEDPSVEVVCVVLPHHMHAETTRASLEAGKHVICEKPAAINLAKLDLVRAAATAAGRRFLIVMNQLYNPVVWRVRKLVEAGALGRVFLSVENAYSNASRAYREPANWRTTRAAAGGGVLIDGGFHMVYRHLHYLEPLGWPRWVSADAAQLAVDASGRNVAEKGEDFIGATVGYEAPLRIQWGHAWTLDAAPTRARQNFLAGTHGTLEMTGEPSNALRLCRASSEEPIAVEPGPYTGTDTTHHCLLDYIDCLVHGREPVRASFQLARASLEVVLAIYESARLGRRVDLSCPVDDCERISS